MLSTDIPILQKNNIRLLILGSRDNLRPKIIQAIEKAEAETASNTAGTLALCFNYGGQIEIVDAVKKIVQSGKKVDDISVELIENNLYKPEVPAVDLIVRTSGEQRISNFMLWRSAYSELMFVDKMWPDLTRHDVEEILEEYSNRSRRFGG
jgi:undecaprenyl diphosphate synthase